MKDIYDRLKELQRERYAEQNNLPIVARKFEVEIFRPVELDETKN